MLSLTAWPMSFLWQPPKKGRPIRRIAYEGGKKIESDLLVFVALPSLKSGSVTHLACAAGVLNTAGQWLK